MMNKLKQEDTPIAVKKNQKQDSATAIKTLTAKTMTGSKELLSMAGRSGTNQSGCCG